MSDPFNQAIEQALRGDAALLETFRLELHTYAGPLAGAGALQWQDRLVIRGGGEITLLSRHSLIEANGRDIGEYRIAASREMISALLRTIRQTPLATTPAPSIGPNDVTTELSVVIGNAQQGNLIGYTNPSAIAPLKPLLDVLNDLKAETRKRPVASLALHAELPQRLTLRVVSLPVPLTFRNDGSETAALTHPTQLSPPTPLEYCRLTYWAKPVFRDDIMPLPSPRSNVVLSLTNREIQEIMEIPAFGTVTQQFHADFSFPEPAVYMAHIAYSTYRGSDRLKERIRLRGCVYSNLLEIAVE